MPVSVVSLRNAEANADAPRYEFRAWARDLCALFEQMQSLARSTEIKECRDLYIVTTGITTFSTKIRGATLDVKQLIERRRPLERWRSYRKLQFPIAGHELRANISPVLGASPDDFPSDSYDVQGFMQQAIAPYPDLRAVAVQKTRYLFAMDACQAEYAEVIVDDARLESVAVESESVAATLRVIARLGLRGRVNLNYQDALKRFLHGGPDSLES
jgi:hypothetical protein